MPELPIFLANTMEPWFARPARVRQIEEIAQRLRRVTFKGEALKGVSFQAGQEIEFRVSERAFRHYTPSRFDAKTGELEVIFYLHGKGPGSIWAENVSVHQSVGVLGPGGGFRVDPSAKKHLFLGDETCLGLFTAMTQALPAGSLCVGAVEVEPGAEKWPAAIGLPLDPAPRRLLHGNALHDWLAVLKMKPDAVYLAGHAQSIARLRLLLTDTFNIPKRIIHTKPYWADGKKGL
jgi:NADPH-dependent ferric siderophore reductase